MDIEKCSVSLSGFQPSPSDQRIIDMAMLGLRDKAPSDSTLNLNIVCDESAVNGFLEISSVSTKFESQKFGSDAISVVQSLSKDVLKQIRSWASARNL
jgi:hypothetical protein